MFLRRRKILWSERLRELIWPSAGWQRSTNYLYHRLGRLPYPPHVIAAGFAYGAAVSFTPFVGMHLALAMLLAWALRANLLAAAVGTAMGNPWTFPFIWVWTYRLGCIILAGSGEARLPTDFVWFFGAVIKAALRFDFEFLFEIAWPVLWPMVVGGLPSAIVIWLVAYFSLKGVIAAYQLRRRVRRLARNGKERKS